MFLKAVNSSAAEGRCNGASDDVVGRADDFYKEFLSMFDAFVSHSTDA